MNERTIIDFLALQNLWWERKSEFPFKRAYKFKRSDYYYLLNEHLEKKEATVIVGPRGVGKSTVMFEIIRELLGFPEDAYGEIDGETVESEDPDFNPKRIIYATFEEAKLKKIKLLELLDIYSKYVLREDLKKIKDKIYLFFDEIQNVDDWGNQIKIIQDLELPIKIFLCGSSSVAMLNEASKAARRVEKYSMHPLKFSDFLRYHIPDKKFIEKVKQIKEYREDFLFHIDKGNAKKIYENFLQFYNDLKKWQTQIELLFQTYFIKGGYPGLLDEKDYQKCSKTLRDTFDLGFHKDLVLAKGIGNPRDVRTLLEYIAAVSSSETNYTSLREKSGAGSNSEQVRRYMYHLENAYLVKQSNYYTRGPKKSTNFKIYLTDVAIRNMLQGYMNELLLKNNDELGKTMETLVFDHFLRFFYKIRPDVPMKFGKTGGKETDIVLQTNGSLVPIEVKNADSPSVSDVDGLRKFCARKMPGIVSCGKRLDIEDNLIFLPHWLLILMC